MTSLRDRLIDAGMLHPVPPLGPLTPLASFAVVIPVFDDPEGLDHVLSAVRAEQPLATVVVVDDGSIDAAAIAGRARAHDASLVRHEQNRGPAAARNTGWHSAADMADAPPDVVVFLDADVLPAAGSLMTLLAHFADPDIAAVAPRVPALPTSSAIGAYEMHSSPLDLGDDAARIVPGSRTSYVPSAAIAIRFSDLMDLGGFDEAMRVGEDVDVIWRLTDAARSVRYEPRAVAHHRSRSTLATFARQRYGYGTSAANLAVRHRPKVAPLQMPLRVAASTVALAVGGPLTRMFGLTGAAVSAAKLHFSLRDRVDEPMTETLRLAAMGHGYAAQGLATATTRTWTPLALLTRKGRRVWLAALVLPALLEWLRDRPALDPVRHIGLRLVDHSSYCAGVWSGVWRQRSIAALLPHVFLRANNDN